MEPTLDVCRRELAEAETEGLKFPNLIREASALTTKAQEELIAWARAFQACHVDPGGPYP
jgi:hypothetical protein